MNKITYSIILPLYKQESHIDEIIQKYVKGLESQPHSWELILVINGGKDNAFVKAQHFAAHDKRITPLELKEGGWGRAVKYGMSKGNGAYLCYTNSARTQINDLLIMLKYAHVNEQTVIKATRIVRNSFFRKLGSVIYNYENRTLFQTAIMDVNGTPKVFPNNTWKRLDVISNDDLIDAEAIAKCFKKEIPVVEVPVRITERLQGKSTTKIRSAIRMYIGLLKLYWSIKNDKK